MRLGECKQAVMRVDLNNGIVIQPSMKPIMRLTGRVPELRVPQIKISGGVMDLQLDSSVCNYVPVYEEPYILFLP